MHDFIPDPRLMQIRTEIEDLAKETAQDPCDIAALIMETFMGSEALALADELEDALFLNIAR